MRRHMESKESNGHSDVDVSTDSDRDRDRQNKETRIERETKTSRHIRGLIHTQTVRQIGDRDNGRFD